MSTLYIAKPYTHILVLYRTCYYYFGCMDGPEAFNFCIYDSPCSIHGPRAHILAFMPPPPPPSGTTQIKRQSVSISTYPLYS